MYNLLLYGFTDPPGAWLLKSYIFLELKLAKQWDSSFLNIALSYTKQRGESSLAKTLLTQLSQMLTKIGTSFSVV